MIDDLGKEQQPLQPEGQPKEKVIELNEWFTPFEEYDQITYEKPSLDDQQERTKVRKFQLANIGEFEVYVSWFTELEERALEDEPYLLVLPSFEKIIEGKEIKKEKEKIETRPMMFDLDILNPDLRNRPLPYKVELETPAGSIISGSLGEPDDFGVREASPHEHWNYNGINFVAPLIPDTEYLMERIRVRFVPKE